MNYGCHLLKYNLYVADVISVNLMYVLIFHTGVNNERPSSGDKNLHEERTDDQSMVIIRLSLVIHISSHQM